MKFISTFKMKKREDKLATIKWEKNNRQERNVRSLGGGK